MRDSCAHTHLFTAVFNRARVLCCTPPARCLTLDELVCSCAVLWLQLPIEIARGQAGEEGVLPQVDGVLPHAEDDEHILPHVITRWKRTLSTRSEFRVSPISTHSHTRAACQDGLARRYARAEAFTGGVRSRRTCCTCKSCSPAECPEPVCAAVQSGAERYDGAVTARKSRVSALPIAFCTARCSCERYFLLPARPGVDLIFR
eukprot:6188473-Pleurochrysis_carterae.AAC.1